MPTEDLIMERLIEGLMATDEPHLLAAARRAYSDRYDRDDAIDRVERYLFSESRWEAVPATVISDVAHEIADRAIQER